MAVTLAQIVEISQEAPIWQGLRVRLPNGLHPAPGQYLLANRPHSDDPLPVALYPARLRLGDLRLVGPLPAAWAVGDWLEIRSPLGRGFRLPPQARRVALAALDGPTARLLPVIEAALDQGADVALYTLAPPAGLPLAVEVLPFSLLHEAPAWAQYLALTAPRARLTALREALGLTAEQGCPAAEVLVDTPIPCGGAAACGVCAVHTHHGWKLACEDGPVFPWDDLEVEG